METQAMITDGMVQCCINDLASWGGIRMSQEQGRALIEKDPEIVGFLVAYYAKAEANDNAGLDTADRDILFDTFAREILGRPGWPMYKDAGTENSETFADAIVQAVKDGKIEAFDPD